MSLPHEATRRLQRDLKELQETPAVSAQPLDGDLFIWHANLVGRRGTLYEGAIFHLVITFPPAYPRQSPSVRVCSPIPHPHVIGKRICLSILSDYENYFNSMNGMGWNSVYTVSTVLMQLQACIMEDLADEDVDGPQLSEILRQIPAAVKQSRAFHCDRCGHTYDNPWPSLTLPMDTDNGSGLEDSDSDDIFANFCPLEEDSWMDSSMDDLPSSMGDPSELSVSATLRSNGSYGEWDDDGEDTLSHSVPNSRHLPHCLSPVRTFDERRLLSTFMSQRLLAEKNSPSRSPSVEEDSWYCRAEQTLVCMHMRSTFEEDILGYGMTTDLRRDTGKIRSISASMDYISYRAFYDFHHHESMDGTEYSFWFPLYINEEHGARAAAVVEDSISLILTGERGAFVPDMVLDFLSKVMCTLMIDVINKKIYASDKALSAYLCFHRWMLYFVQKYPHLLEQANQTVNNFKLDEQYRHKDVVPSLGSFLALLSICDLSWEEVSDAYLQEAYDRGVYWVLIKSQAFAKAVLDDAPFTPALTDEFFHQVISGKQLLVFHVYFLENVARREELSLRRIAEHYDETYGLSSTEKTERLREFCKSIHTINSWGPFYEGVGKVCPSQQELAKKLHRAIQNSERRGYHEKNSIGSRKQRCWRFVRGHCQYGENCRFAHVKYRESKSPWME